MLKQGQKLKAIALPDYNAEGASPIRVGSYGCTSITVTQLRGPMGHYDCARALFDNGDDEIFPLHLCEFIQIDND